MGTCWRPGSTKADSTRVGSTVFFGGRGSEGGGTGGGSTGRARLGEDRVRRAGRTWSSVDGVDIDLGEDGLSMDPQTRHLLCPRRPATAAAVRPLPAREDTTPPPTFFPFSLPLFFRPSSDDTRTSVAVRPPQVGHPTRSASAGKSGRASRARRAWWSAARAGVSVGGT